MIFIWHIKYQSSFGVCPDLWGLCRAAACAAVHRAWGVVCCPGALPVSQGHQGAPGLRRVVGAGAREGGGEEV